MKLSMIIPVLNEEGSVGRCLDRLDALKGDFDVLFVDGGSVDATRELIVGRRPLIQSPPGRGRQMNAGARAAGGNVLLFLHCDSFLPVQFCDKIDSILRHGYDWGCFHLAFDCASPLLRLCAWVSDFRVKTRHIVFGDQGMFIRRKLFEDCGGFPEIALMEDYALSERLRAVATPGLARGTIVTSARRFQERGVLPTLLKMQFLQYRYRRGDAAEQLLKDYNKP